MAQRRGGQPAAGAVPEPGLLVLAGGGDEPAIGAEHHRIHRQRVLQHAQLVAVEIVERDQLAGAGQQQPLTRAEQPAAVGGRDGVAHGRRAVGRQRVDQHLAAAAQHRPLAVQRQQQRALRLRHPHALGRLAAQARGTEQSLPGLQPDRDRPGLLQRQRLAGPGVGARRHRQAHRDTGGACRRRRRARTLRHRHAKLALGPRQHHRVGLGPVQCQRLAGGLGRQGQLGQQGRKAALRQIGQGPRHRAAVVRVERQRARQLQLRLARLALVEQAVGAAEQHLGLGLGQPLTLLVGALQQHRKERDQADRQRAGGDPGAHHPAQAAPPQVLAQLQRLRVALALAAVAAVARHLGQQVVRQLQTQHAGPLFQAQQPALDQHRHLGPQHARQAQRIVVGEAVAKTALGEQLVLDELAQPRVGADEAGFVKVSNDLLLGRALQQPGVDGRLFAAAAPLIQLPADHRQQRRLDLQALHLRAAMAGTAARGRDEVDDLVGHLGRHQVAARAQDRGLGLLAAHAGQAHPVAHDRRHHLAQALELGQKILAEGKHHPKGVAGHVQIGRQGRLVGRIGHQRGGDALLDQVGQLIEKAPAALVDRVQALAQREQLLELVEHQHRCQQAVARAPEVGIAAVEIFPERGARDSGRGLHAMGRALGADRRVQLLGQRRRIVTQLQPHIDRQKVLLAQLREQAGPQQRGLAQAGLAEQHRQRRAPDRPQQAQHVLVAAMEIVLRGLGERQQARPGLVRGERRNRWVRGHCNPTWRLR